jgi:endonuclease/exonuclease/phosphatase family metal-dependent hydrolase
VAPSPAIRLGSGCKQSKELMKMPETLSVFSWNVQSPGDLGGSADLELLIELLLGFTGYDVYGFCEVLDQSWADGFKNALEESQQDEFTYVLGKTGKDDILLVLYRKRTLEETGEPEELMKMKEGGGRAPLVVPLSLKAGGTRFLFMINHLHSTSAEKRISQVRELNKWARSQELPVIAAGDYNFFDVSTTGSPLNDLGFRLLTEDDVFYWIRPEKLVQTQFDRNPDNDWILDFVFVTGDAKSWDASSEILLADKPREFFFPSPSMTDHRPVSAFFRL